MKTLLKSAWFYVVFAFTLMGGIIFALLQQVGGLKRKVRVTEAEAELGKTLASLGDAKNAADKKEAEFRAADRELADLLNKPSGE